MKNDSKSVRQASVGRMLNLLTRRLTAEMESRLKVFGLNLNGFYIMMTLLETEGLTQSDLGSRIKLPPYGMTRLIDSLQKTGLVERRADPKSRRNHLIFLTAEGHAIGPKMFATVKGVNDSLLGGLPKAERQAFTATLAKLV